MMKGFFSRLFACKCSGSSDNEVVAAIAVALQMYGDKTGSRPETVGVPCTVRSVSGWNDKSYGMAQLPQRNRKW